MCFRSGCDWSAVASGEFAGTTVQNGTRCRSETLGVRSCENITIGPVMRWVGCERRAAKGESLPILAEACGSRSNKTTLEVSQYDGVANHAVKLISTLYYF